MRVAEVAEVAGGAAQSPRRKEQPGKPPHVSEGPAAGKERSRSRSKGRK